MTLRMDLEEGQHIPDHAESELDVGILMVRALIGLSEKSS